MKYANLLYEVEQELLKEKKEIAKEEIKEKLIEIECTEKVLVEMKDQLATLLEQEI